MSLRHVMHTHGKWCAAAAALSCEGRFSSHLPMAAAGASYNFRNQELAVAGGGDTAAEEAVYLTKYASKVGLPSRSEWDCSQRKGLRLSLGADAEP